jgi:hypothetical protein
MTLANSAFHLVYSINNLTMRGKENLLSQFAANECPYFIIVDSKYNCVGKNDKYEDISRASERLEAFVNTFDPDNRSRYSIYCYEVLPDNKLKGKCKDLINSGDHDYILSYTPYALQAQDEEAKTNWRVQNELNRREMAERLERIETALMAKQVAENTEDDEDIAEEAEPKSMVGALMENPQIQGALAGALSAWLTKMLAPASAPMAVAGVPEDDKLTRLNAALDTLHQYDDQLIEHLEKLAAMAQKDTAKFKFLLTML